MLEVWYQDDEREINQMIDAQVAVRNYDLIGRSPLTINTTRAQDARLHEVLGALQVFRISLHVAFALLLILGIVRSVLSGATSSSDAATHTRTWVVLALAIALGLGYLGGTVYENRAAKKQTHVGPARVAVWLAGVLVLWSVVSWLDSSFVWLAFPLFFVALSVCKRGVGLVLVISMAFYVGFSLSMHTDNPSPAIWLGPILGAATACVMHWLYRLIAQIAQQQSAVIKELQGTRDALALSERAAGRTAERTRIARDIHDTLAQGFSSIILIARASKSGLAKGNIDRVQERIDLIETTASQNLAQARELVAVFAAPEEAVNVVSALSGAVSSANATARASSVGNAPGTAFELRSEVPEVLVEDSLGSTLTKSVQSLLSNVLIHAQATKCVVTLTALPEQLLVDIFDNGVGFEPEPAAVDGAARVHPAPGNSHRETNSQTSPPVGTVRGGFGLKSVASRMSEVGGTMSVESEPGSGTLISLSVPLHGGTSIQRLPTSQRGKQEW